MTNKGFVKCEWLSLPLALPYLLAFVFSLLFFFGTLCQSLLSNDRGWKASVCFDAWTADTVRHGISILYARTQAMEAAMVTGPTQKKKKSGIDDDHHKIFTHQITDHKNGIFISATTTAPLLGLPQYAIYSIYTQKRTHRHRHTVSYGCFVTRRIPSTGRPHDTWAE